MDSMGIMAASSDDVPVNVVVTGIIDAQPHRFRIRAAPGGVSVGHYRITAGTLGCLAFGRQAPRNNRILILSNNHVLANVNSGAFGDCVIQPGAADLGHCPQDQVANPRIIRPHQSNWRNELCGLRYGLDVAGPRSQGTHLPVRWSAAVFQREQFANSPLSRHARWEVGANYATHVRHCYRFERNCECELSWIWYGFV